MARIKIRESAVVSACIKYLWARGCFVWRQNVGAYKPEGSSRYIRFGIKGMADILGVTPSGRFLAVEAKSATGKQRPEQAEFQRRIEEKGGIYILAHSLDELVAHSEALA